jgi:HEAT repeat protein
LIPLLEAEPDERVVAGAIRAAGNVRNVRLLPSLIAKLSNPKLSRVATDTLVKFGVDAAEALSFALSNEKEDMKCKLLIPRILGRTASQEGMNILMEFLEVENEELRMNIYQAIDRMVSLGADADFDTSRIEDLCEMEIKNYFQQVIMTQELGGRLEPMLLGDVLTQQRTKVRERVLHLLSILYPSGGIESVAVAFRSAYANTRANALELLDNLLHGKLKQGLLAMFEDSSIERASNSAAGLYPDLEHKEKDGWIKKLLEDQNPWLVACTLQHISHSSEAKHKYVKTIMALGEVSDHLVRETTLSVLKECLDEETYHNFVTPFLDDSHPIVMEFAKSQFEVL